MRQNEKCARGKRALLRRFCAAFWLLGDVEITFIHFFCESKVSYFHNSVSADTSIPVMRRRAASARGSAQPQQRHAAPLHRHNPNKIVMSHGLESAINAHPPYEADLGYQFNGGGRGKAHGPS